LGNNLIIIGGYCGAGKSTFARNLSKVLRVPCFIKDTIKETMGDSYAEAWSSETHKKGSAVAVDLMLHIAESFLAIDKPCILEANFRISEAETIKTLLEKYNSNCLTFIFDGDLNAIYERYFLREKAGNRHWVHLVPGESKDSWKEGQLKGKLTEVAIGQTIQIDTSNLKKINFDDLFSIAGKFIQG